jgi:hypothetical protein
VYRQTGSTKPFSDGLLFAKRANFRHADKSTAQIRDLAHETVAR